MTKPGTFRSISLVLLAAFAAGSIFVFPATGEARSKKKKASNLPPLPSPTVSLDFDTVDDANQALFASEVSAPSAITEAVGEVASPTWRIADWRESMQTDQRKLDRIEAVLTARLSAMQKQNFPVAVRYLRGIHAAVGELAQLGRQTNSAFNEDFPEARDGERAPQPPEPARRLRLFVDRAEALFVSAERYLARSVKVQAEKVVRLEGDED